MKKTPFQASGQNEMHPSALSDYMALTSQVEDVRDPSSIIE
jgi:hypothetical protein